MAVVMPPTATPIAARVPMSILGLASGGLPAADLSAICAAVVSWLVTLASAAAARLATWSSTHRSIRLYGVQNAWTMLTGFSMIFVIGGVPVLALAVIEDAVAADHEVVGVAPREGRRNGHLLAGALPRPGRSRPGTSG